MKQITKTYLEDRAMRFLKSNLFVKFVFIATILLIACFYAKAHADNCVKIDDVISTIESLIELSDSQNSSITYTVCNTCECWYSDNRYESEYYKCLARVAKEREEAAKQRRNILNRIKQYGVCK
jgi:hypothetical protein